MTKKYFLLITFLFFVVIFCWRLGSSTATQTTIRKAGYVSYVQKALGDKNGIARTIDKIFPEPSASLLNGILFGIKGDIPLNFYLALQSAGMLHVIALSGQNISILIAVIVKLTAFLGKRVSIFVSIIGIVAFILFVGPSASVVRAGIMGVLSMLALIFGRQYLAIWGLFLSASLMVFIKPDLIRDVGFQLSFLATFGIIVFSHKQTKTAKTFIERVAYDFRVTFWTTIAAQVFTTPVIMANFGRISLVSFVTNVLVLWTVPFIMGLGFLAAALGLIWLPLGLIIGFFANLFLIYFVTLVYISSSVPFASVDVQEFKLWMACMYYGVMFLIIAIRNFQFSRTNFQ